MKMGTITYYLNEDGRKMSLLNNGDGKSEQQVTVEINKDNLELFYVDDLGNAILNVGSKVSYDSHNIIDYKINNSYDGRPSINKITEIITFNKLMVAEELLKFEINRRDRIKLKKDILQPEYDMLLKTYNIKQDEKKEKEEQKRIEGIKERERQEAKKKAKKERLENEKKMWIESKGSDYLKKAFSLGHNCQRKYATERAQLEFPDYMLDFDNESTWNDRNNPSEESVNIVWELKKKYNNTCIEIVWLTNPTRNTTDNNEYYDNCDSFKPCEAITIQEFLSNYNLVKVI